jgi:Flp pilus assembly protein TadB
MNIKYKAILITLAIPLIAVAFVYTIVQYPLIILFTVLGGLLYTVYRGVLNYLEHNERFKK